MIIKSFLSQSPSNPKVLITSGWHGDEPTGISVLHDLVPNYKNLNITTVNCINTYGCSKGYRLDKNGLSPDDGFIVREEYQSAMSVEAKGIKATEGVFGKFDLHIALHNDPKRIGYYLYTWGNCSNLEVVAHKYFESQKLNKTFETFTDLQDGSYYDYMYTKHKQRCLLIELGNNNIHDNEKMMKEVLNKVLEVL